MSCSPSVAAPVFRAVTGRGALVERDFRGRADARPGCEVLIAQNSPLAVHVGEQIEPLRHARTT